MKNPLAKFGLSPAKRLELMVVLLVALVIPSLILQQNKTVLGISTESQNASRSATSKTTDVQTPHPTPAIKPFVPGFVSGYVYLDNNNNHVRDNGETAYVDATVFILTNTTTAIKTGVAGTPPGKQISLDSNGHFLYKTSKDDRAIYVMAQKGYVVASANPFRINSEEGNHSQVVEFTIVKGTIPVPSGFPKPSPTRKPEPTHSQNQPTQ